jgi:RNA polymerase sigma-70 factor (ECF subfamily)
MGASVTDDAELYSRWRAGDEQAAQELVERYYDSVVRFFRTKVGPQADDLVQRTFLACAEGNFRGESGFRSYLFGVARNILFEFFRGKKRDAKVDPDFSMNSVHELDPGLSTMAAERAEQRLLVQALQRIPLEIQMTLELFYWEDLSIEELSHALGIPTGTVKSRLHRGRTLLREAMEKIPSTDNEKQSVRALITEWRDKLPRESDD